MKFRILGLRTALYSFEISLALHLVLLLFIDINILGIIEYWGFFITDVCLWSLGLIPMVAVGRGRLSALDLLFPMSLIFKATYATVMCVVAIDFNYLAKSITFGSPILSSASQSVLLLRLAEAEIILIIFFLAVLITNPRSYPAAKRIASRHGEDYSAIITGLVLVGLGVFGFVMLWAERGYISTLTTDIGRNIVESGQGRFAMFQTLAIHSIPLGLSGAVVYLLRRFRVVSSTAMFIFLGVVLASVFPQLVNGSRIQVVFLLATPLIIMANFGLRVSKRIAFTTGFVCVVIIGVVTLVRGNALLGGGSIEDQIKLSINEYTKSKGSAIGPLLDLDRVGPIALIVEYLKGNSGYLNGSSLIAEIVNQNAMLWNRIVGETVVEGSKVLIATQHITTWRFNSMDVMWAVPPSYAGEFFMQYGYLSLIALSLVFGFMFNHLREMISCSRSIIGRWCLLAIGLGIIRGVPTEISLIYGTLIYYIVPIVAIYYAVLLTGE